MTDDSADVDGAVDTDLCALRQAGLVDHLLSVELDVEAGEQGLLGVLASIADGPVFRLRHGRYAFRLPNSRIDDLTEALAEAVGTLQALGEAADGGDMNEAALQVLRSLGEAAGETHTANGLPEPVNAAIAVRTARRAAATLRLSGDDGEGLAAEIKALRSLLEGAGGTLPASLKEKWLVDLANSAEETFGRLNGLALAEKEDVEAIARTVESVIAARPGVSEEKIYALLRQRLERLQSSADHLLAHLDSAYADPGEGARDAQEALLNLLPRLRAALEQSTEVFGPFQPGCEPEAYTTPNGGDNGPVVEDILAVERLVTELRVASAGVDEGELFHARIAGALAELGARIDAATQIPSKDIEDIRTALDDLRQGVPEDAETALKTVAERLAVLTEQFPGEMEELRAGLDLRFQTLMSQEGGVAADVEKLGKRLGGLPKQFEKLLSSGILNEIGERVTAIATSVDGARALLNDLPEQNGAAVRANVEELLADVEVRAEKNWVGLQTQMAEVLSATHAAGMALEPLQAKVAELVQASDGRMEGMSARLDELTRALGEREDMAVGKWQGVEMHLVGVGERLSALENKVVGPDLLQKLEDRIDKLAEPMVKAVNRLDDRMQGELEATEARQANVLEVISGMQTQIAALAQQPHALEVRLERLEKTLGLISRAEVRDARDQAALVSGVTEILRRLDADGLDEAEAEDSPAKTDRRDREIFAAAVLEIQEDLRLMLAEFVQNVRNEEDDRPDTRTVPKRARPGRVGRSR
ncbi:hypothetical protein [Algicella marina]|uniref:Uncharacterized protein n=1 Tax=Algicella marina TaxID=2683284 RepID=A0A6P1T2W5_9RHOB|nr:hypothetical protein [Algicella marina]QHQ36095.1 hypothetical protein GO499_13375 [Algicella marina]